MTVKGFGDGDVNIQIGASEDGTVESLIIDASTQTEGLGAKASEEAFTSQFIGKQGGRHGCRIRHEYYDQGIRRRPGDGGRTGAGRRDPED